MSYHHYYLPYMHVNSLVEKLRGAGVGVECRVADGHSAALCR